MSQRELFSVAGLPVFQNKMFADRTAALNCPTGTMRLVQDDDSGLIFNAAFDPGLLEYDADYQNEQACSGVFQQHLADVTAIIQRQFAGRSLLEVGCGKGYFLQHLRQAGYPVTGIDPAYEGDDPHVIKAPFVAGLGVTADGIVLRHVLEHIVQPFDFLNSIREANGGRGRIYIEVPCFDWIRQHRAWFDIFYEHVNYFRLADFQRLFGTVHESGHLFGGQYLYVVAELASLRRPRAGIGEQVDFPVDFLHDIARFAALVHNRRCAIWGGASKGVIFAWYLQRAGVSLTTLIDINPAKQGKFIACSGVRVSAPDEALPILLPGDTILVMNSNYLAEIVRLAGDRFNYLQVDQHEF